VNIADGLLAPRKAPLSQLRAFDPAKLTIPRNVNGNLATRRNGIIYGNGYVNGNEDQSVKGIDRKDEQPYLPSAKVDVRIPDVVVEEGIKIVQEALDKVVEIPNRNGDES
jgi:hypothetical protein